jgi:hypothetical protein
MDIDRLRWLVREGKHLTIDGAVEIAKAAPDLLFQMEALDRAWKAARGSAITSHERQDTP